MGRSPPASTAIRAEAGVPGEFPPEVVAAAEEVATRLPGAAHVDRTSVEYATLDPATATDLDQAFAAEQAGDDIILHYAIADVGFFVDPGSVLDRTAWERGGTVYLPDGKVPLYPPALSEGAASLLPTGPRPAVVFTVRIDAAGGSRLDGAERAVIHSRHKLAYEDVDMSALRPTFAELARRIVAAEDRRGAPRVEFPEQVLELTENGWQLRFDARLESEDRNAGMSLATNMAVADALHAAKTGLFRVMPDVPERAIRRLRYTAEAFGLDWPAGVSLARFQRSLPANDQRSAAFLLAVRRAGGGASYRPYVDGEKPWHAAMAAPYAHATAPLRRLADRYVVEAALAVANGDPVPEHVAGGAPRAPSRDGPIGRTGQPRRQRRPQPRRGCAPGRPRGRAVRRDDRRRGPPRTGDADRRAGDPHACPRRAGDTRATRSASGWSPPTSRRGPCSSNGSS